MSKKHQGIEYLTTLGFLRNKENHDRD